MEVLTVAGDAGEAEHNRDDEESEDHEFDDGNVGEVAIDGRGIAVDINDMEPDYRTFGEPDLRVMARVGSGGKELAKSYTVPMPSINVLGRYDRASCTETEQPEPCHVT